MTDFPLPQPSDAEFYREFGYWISPVIIPADVLDAAEKGMERFYAGDHDRTLPDLPPVRGWTPADGDVLRKNDYASLRVRELAALIRHPAIGGSAAILSGSQTVRLWHDQLLHKPVEAPGLASRVGWHTDRQYWLSCTSEEMLTAWVAFHDVDETLGGVAFLPGSHRWDVERLDFWQQDLTLLEAEIARQGYPVQPVAPALRRGQVTFHHCRTVHGSGPNRSTRPRRSIAIHMQTGDNQWRPHRRDDGTLTSHPNDDLVRTLNGVPDYGDPSICPQLWPPESSTSV